jgi:hypothetical protein
MRRAAAPKDFARVVRLISPNGAKVVKESGARVD